MYRLCLRGAICLLTAVLTACGTGRPADLILVAGRIFTADPDRPFVQALAVRGNRIASLGDSTAILRRAGAGTDIRRYPDALAVPGFNDAHVHFLDGGLGLAGVQLRSAHDRYDFRDRIVSFAAGLEAGEWILRGNWDHEAWPDHAHPTRQLIDPVTPDHPVFVTRLDGHISLANSLALELAGVTADTPDPEGGEIVRDPVTGEPTGILIDTAQDLVYDVIPANSDDTVRRGLLAASRHASQVGVTSIQDNADRQIWRVYEQLRAEGLLTVRVNAWYPIALRDTLAAEGIAGPSGDEWLQRGTVKIFSDGSMGAGSAWFFEPYTDEPSTSGLAIIAPAELTRLITAADALGLQVATHAIGDRANAVTLDAYAAARAANPDRRTERRHRIEHAQVLRDSDLERFQELGIIASIQPSHAIDDMRWAEARIGTERCRIAYRVGSFFEAGIPVAFGTDWFVEPLDPRLGLYAAVTREFPAGGPEGGWFGEERITLAEAITAYTAGSAWAESMEHIKGRLQRGYLADIAVFAGDLFASQPRDWLKTPVILTIVDGKVVYEGS